MVQIVTYPGINGKLCKQIIFIAQDVYHNTNEGMKLEGPGIPYVVIGYNSIAQQQKMIQLIGEIMGAKEKAAKYNQYYQRCLACDLSLNGFTGSFLPLKYLMNWRIRFSGKRKNQQKGQIVITKDLLGG